MSKLTISSTTKRVGECKMVMQEGYPQINAGLDNTEITCLFISSVGDLEIPAIGSDYNWSTIDGIPGIGLTQLSSVRITHKPTGLVELELQYSIPECNKPTGSDSGESNFDFNPPPATKEISLTTQDTDLPLEQHPKYLAHWNHDLWGVHGEPSDYLTLKKPRWDAPVPEKKPEGDSTEVQKYFRMCKPGEKPDCEWMTLLKSCSKPGVESFRRGVSTITVVTRAMSKSAVKAAIQADYTRSAPPETFGLSGEWMKMGSNIVKNGNYWENRQDYVRAPMGWDKDLYD